MSKYKVIIFDLDGTAIPNKPNGMPSERLIKAVAAAKSKIKLCAATGRPITNAKPILDALQLDEPCVISAGTQIVLPQTGKIVWEAAIEANDINKILEICGPYHYELLIKNELMGEGDKASNRIIDEHVNVMYLMGCAEPDATEILNRLSRIPSITAAGVKSWTHEGVDIHITHVNATKEHAIIELLNNLGIDKADSVGVGDANNDVHLFESVGYKVAMGNATELLKSKADVICEDVDDDGLAKLIEHLAEK
ncbi:HAD-IIB family hydrolase [Candidatus Saccharibacteria bacterium]|nr:HAD-IIB family hydrolase [Candidatus Saccharibacteria bacterium]